MVVFWIAGRSFRVSLDECVSDFGGAIIVGKQGEPFCEFRLSLVVWVFVFSFLCHFLPFFVIWRDCLEDELF